MAFSKTGVGHALILHLVGFVFCGKIFNRRILDAQLHRTFDQVLPAQLHQIFQLGSEGGDLGLHVQFTALAFPVVVITQTNGRGETAPASADGHVYNAILLHQLHHFDAGILHFLLLTFQFQIKDPGNAADTFCFGFFAAVFIGIPHGIGQLRRLIPRRAVNFYGDDFRPPLFLRFDHAFQLGHGFVLRHVPPRLEIFFVNHPEQRFG